MSRLIKKWVELSRQEAFRKYSRKIEKVVFRLPDNSETDFYIKQELLADRADKLQPTFKGRLLLNRLTAELL